MSGQDHIQLPYVHKTRYDNLLNGQRVADFLHGHLLIMHFKAAIEKMFFFFCCHLVQVEQAHRCSS